VDAASLADTSYNYAQPIPAYVEPQASTIVINADPTQTTVVQSDSSSAPPAPGISLPATAPPEGQPADQTEDPKVTEAVGIFDEARELFKKGDYAAAQTKIDKAITVLPQDRVLHEFRGLILFAQGKYPEAAATLYAVLSVGPGWNWETLSSYYPDPKTYTEQLRTLENHARAHPKAAEDRFVEVYHYLVLGQPQPAIKVLHQLTVLLPNDQLSAQLLQALEPKAPAKDDRPKPAAGL
jgi:tetratricopeptide (TPR) repeat protein